MKKLLLIDGHVLIFRSHYAFANRPRLTTDGRNTSIEFGFTKALISMIESEKPTHIAVTFDTAAPTHRHETYSEYKANRQETPQEIHNSTPNVYEILRAMRIPIFELDGYEADDLIGTITRLAENENFQTYIATIDKDLAQLVSDQTLLYRFSTRSEAVEIMGVAEVCEKWKIDRPAQIIDLLGLWGDSSDNIPGVKGIGEKTAQKLIAQFGSIEAVLKNLDQLKGRQRENLENDQEKVRLFKQLVTIDRDVPISVDFDKLKLTTYDLDRLREICIDLEFQTLGKQLLGDSFTIDRSENQKFTTIDDLDPDYQIVNIDQVIVKLRDQSKFCFDLETDRLDEKSAEIVGIAFSFAEKTGFYLPFPTDRDDAKKILDQLRPIFENDQTEKIGHNLKFDLNVLRWHGIKVHGRLFDTMIAHQLIAPDQRHRMNDLAKKYLNYSPIEIEMLIGEKKTDQLSMRQIDPDHVAKYACEDADITFQLRDKLADQIAEHALDRVFYEVECPLITVLVEIEFEGFSLDLPALSTFSDQLTHEIVVAENQIYEAVPGPRFNIDSPKQIGEVLFDRLKLESDPKRTKTGKYRTDAKTLESLANRHKIVRQILNFRELRKLKSTYVDALPGHVFDRSKKVHTKYNQTFVATGRMQSHTPNLQNIPIRTDRGREMRRAFVPRSDDFNIMSADYSQIELRIIAELSGDENLISAFEKGLDIHTQTAAKIFSVEMADVDAEMRRRAKMVNYGIPYGISAFGLAQRLGGISRRDAQKIIDHYFREFPLIPLYMTEAIAFAQEHGYVQTITGRRRYLPEINARNANVRKSAERNAINSPIQGSSADLIKLAMSAIFDELTKENCKTRMILQVHDELVFDLAKSEEDQVVPMVIEKMKTAIPMSVPIEVEVGLGKNWLEAH